MNSQRLTTLEFQGSRSDLGASVRGLASEGTSTESRLCGATTRPTRLVRSSGRPRQDPSHTQQPKRRRHRGSRDTYDTRPRCRPRCRGQGGPRDRLLRAIHACGDLAGGLTPTGTHSGPANRIGNSVARHRGHPPAPETPARHDTHPPSQRHQRTATDRRHNEAARPHRGSGGSCAGPLGGHQQRFQRIWVPVAPRRSQASTTRAAMPASADLPHVRGSYCFLMPTSPSILRTPS